MKTHRLRFAPSPTGHLHIGGARTALYNWLVAKKTGGTFILRIEDTDRERSTEEYIHSILDAMKWLKLDWQEGPFYQTQRLDVYKEHVDQLIREKKAYRCYCTAQELEAKRKQAEAEKRKPKYDATCRNVDPVHWQQDPRPYCIRFKAPQEGSTVVEDLIRGRIEFQNIELDDLIIWRTDGTPTYNFCVVVDDVTMQMTEVIRGDDHLNNTPRQILLYQAFNYPTPQFAHVPMILGSDKTRLSKRHGATSVLAFRDMGFLPDALLNYLARLGWAHGDKEVFTREELIECFDIAAVGKSPCVFSPDKLLWLNGVFIRNAKPEELAPEVKRILGLKQILVNDDAKLIDAVKISQEKVKTLAEMADFIDFLFIEKIEISEAAQKVLQTPESIERVRKLIAALEPITSFDKESLHAAVEKIFADSGMKLKELAQSTRAALCGRTVSPGFYEMLMLLGKEKTIQRLTPYA